MRDVAVSLPFSEGAEPLQHPMPRILWILVVHSCLSAAVVVARDGRTRLQSIRQWRRGGQPELSEKVSLLVREGLLPRLLPPPPLELPGEPFAEGGVLGDIHVPVLILEGFKFVVFRQPPPVDLSPNRVDPQLGEEGYLLVLELVAVRLILPRLLSTPSRHLAVEPRAEGVIAGDVGGSVHLLVGSQFLVLRHPPRLYGPNGIIRTDPQFFQHIRPVFGHFSPVARARLHCPPLP
mmetsp:Transcript_43107/g.131297  ORF Transcript_43107/g.131297 Transcript_43107/m.131297 type:complete len:235 (-) Transcript_43107:3022-3726(-)